MENQFPKTIQVTEEELMALEISYGIRERIDNVFYLNDINSLITKIRQA